MEGLESPNQRAVTQSVKGLLVACTILTLWLVSLLFLLSIDVSKTSVWIVGLAFVWQVFLYTGLFITAHDAMHGVVYPSNIKINHAIGTLAVWCYGLFSYQELLKKHWLHHKYPSTERDPDYHEGRSENFFIWYFQFMKHYWSWGRIIALVVLFHSIHYFLGIPDSNLALFWVVPSLLSSVQLFYFGTFLTHREPDEGYTNPHRAKSTNFPVIWSFLTCYHFGYHQEHHEYPNIPWWQLPQVYRLRNKSLL
ncbi:fatty acid desaturase [Leptolyngbya sp. FACHB-8]|nr:fatty acid desaturase [Leptolyngbya sp. FACHB-8]MBD1909371.1 fatty acid desaturase [Leptolyngbya sp. FACHB-8]